MKVINTMSEDLILAFYLL